MSDPVVSIDVDGKRLAEYDETAVYAEQVANIICMHPDIDADRFFELLQEELK